MTKAWCSVGDQVHEHTRIIEVCHSLGLRAEVVRREGGGPAVKIYYGVVVDERSATPQYLTVLVNTLDQLLHDVLHYPRPVVDTVSTR